MSNRPSQTERLEELLSALCDERISADEMQELETLLSDDPAAQEHFADYLQLHGNLHWDLAAQSAPAEDPLARARPDRTDGREVAGSSPLWHSLRSRLPVSSSTALSLGVAGMVMAAFMAGMAVMSIGPGGADPAEPVYVARMNRTVDCVWKDGGLGKSEGADLMAGQRLELLRGLAVVTFDGGTQVILQGKTSFRLDSPAEAFLEQGRVTAQVPPRAEGFTVQTPAVRVIDHGTEFGVEVRPDKQASVHVFAGKVETQGLDEQAEIFSRGLTAGEAAQFDPATRQVVEMPADETAFARDVPSLEDLQIGPEYVQTILDDAPLAYWRFESLGGGVQNVAGGRYHGRVQGRVELAGAGENHALAFDGSGGHVLVDEPIETFGSGDYTIEFWMFPLHYQFSTLISLHAPPQPNAKRSLHKHLGVVEVWDDSVPRQMRRIRFLHRSPPGTGGGSNVYSSGRYLLSRWQHVVALKRADQLLLYLNGQPIASKSDGTNYTVDPIVGIGKLIHPQGSGGRHFVGRLDEIAIYDRALTPEEIEEHYRLAGYGQIR